MRGQSEGGKEHTPARPSIALCHEWLANRHGSEKTFEAMAEALPTADLYALTFDRSVPFSFSDRPVTTTFLDRVGLLGDRRVAQLPLMPLAWRYASRRAYDVVVTSSHACVKGFRPGRRALHLCYCYTPLRYVWTPDIDERRRRNAATRVAERCLRSWDSRAASWVDEFAAISRAVGERIERFYGCAARVIAPPVDTAFFHPPAERSHGSNVLAVSRMVQYKRLDVVVRACRRVGASLTLAGAGPEEARLRELANSIRADVTFVISPDDSTLRELYRCAGVVMFAAEEDFGIVTVEAQACGTPVVALARGGSLDTVIDGCTGVLVSEADEEMFATAIDGVLRAPVDRAACRANAERFSRERFLDEFANWVRGAMAARGLSPDRSVRSG